MTQNESSAAHETARKPQGELRRGWTTGACATAAVKAALNALLTGEFPDPVVIILPKGETPAFALALESLGEGKARAGIVKDAGDDPDVTHGATIIAQVAFAKPGTGIVFRAGDGVGTVTLPGLPVPPGEPAINPVPRAMMTAEIEALCTTHDVAADVEVTISVPGGEHIAQKTWNPRLGIVGGISILGTTGVVHPFSCSAWIHSIHRGIDVARAAGLSHILGATGSTSEAAAQAIHRLPEIALIDMGDFAGGLLKYLRQHPVPRLTIAGGFAKLTKLAQGALDLHSARSQVDMAFLADISCELQLNQFANQRIQDIRNRILAANTALQALEIAQQSGTDLAGAIAVRARETALSALRGAPVDVEIIVTNRHGAILAQAGFSEAAMAHDAGSPRETILILGGTAEASTLAAELAAANPGARLVTSLAGRTREPAPLAGETRIGGFGGAAGLAEYLRENAVTRLIDATHPFATQISANAVEASRITGVPLETRTRRPWTRQAGDLWFEVATLQAACAAIPPPTSERPVRVLLALGAQHIGVFASRDDVHFVVRMVDAPEHPLPFTRYTLVTGKPGATMEAEEALLREHAITHVVCRNSGGAGAYAKIGAARSLGLPVIMVGRPQ